MEMEKLSLTSIAGWLVEVIFILHVTWLYKLLVCLILDAAIISQR